MNTGTVYRYPRGLHSRRSGKGQRGVSLFFALIAVLIMMIAAVAIVRSFSTSLSQSGNVAFKRDLTNQSERAIDAVFAEMNAGGLLIDPTALNANVINANYSASILPTNVQGVPNSLLSDAAFAAVGVATRDITLTDPNGTSYGTVRYVIDRLCSGAGAPSALGESACVSPPTSGSNLTDSARLISAARATTGGGGGAGASSRAIVYRVSIRVRGARGTEGFYQATFAR